MKATRFDLDLLDRPRPIDPITVEEGVGELVHQRLDGLSRRDIRPASDLLLQEVAVTVPAPAPITNHLEPCGHRLVRERIPDSLRRIAG